MWSTAADVGHLSLERISILADARIQLLSACADYNTRIIEALERRMAAEQRRSEAQQDLVRLSMMRSACEGFRRAHSKRLSERRQAERQQSQWDKHVRYIGYLVQADRLAPPLVRCCWIGMSYWLRNIPAEVAGEIAEMRVPLEARDGANFAYNREADKPCDDAPASITYVGQLMAWMRMKSYMPRQGSAALVLLTEVAAHLECWATTSLEQIRIRLAEIQQSLDELDRQGWQASNVEKWQPM